MSTQGFDRLPDIESAKNSAVVETAKLHRARERRKHGRTLLEGPHLLEAAVGSGNYPETVFALPDDAATLRLCSDQGIECRTVSEAALSRLAPTEHPRGPVAVLPIPEPAPLQATDTIVLVGISDPGNAGTLVRSAVAFGFRVAVAQETVDVWSPKVLRAGAGAHFTVGISRLGADPVGELRTAGLVVAATSPAADADAVDPSAVAVALLIGSEPRGLPDQVLGEAETVARIPMTDDIESLNAAVAGSILMYERARTRPGGAV